MESWTVGVTQVSCPRATLMPLEVKASESALVQCAGNSQSAELSALSEIF